MSEKFWHLKNSDLFRSLDDDELARLEKFSRVKQFPRKNPIYLPADAANSVFMLTSGRAKICHLTFDGKQSILFFIEPGELFGELAIFDEGDRDEYAEAIDPTTVMMIPAEEIRRLMERHAEISLGVTKLIGFRRRRIERRLKNLLFLSNRERLAHVLLELMEQYGEPDGRSGVRLRIKLSHQDLANIIGSTRETVTVVLGDLQEAGLVEVGRRKIIIRKPDALAGVVNRTAPKMPPTPSDSAPPNTPPESKFGEAKPL